MGQPMAVQMPETIEECDRRLENCRLILEAMQVRSSQRMVWIEIDDLLEQRVRLKRRRKRALAATDSP